MTPNILRLLGIAPGTTVSVESTAVLTGTAPDEARQALKELRETLLTLHKALLDSERTSYELVHGTIPSPGAFLQLLINDSWFAWLRPVTTLLVEIDDGVFQLASGMPGRIPSNQRLHRNQ